MKHLSKLALLCCLVAFYGCATPYYALGTSESDFVKKSHAQMVSMQQGQSVYMISVHKMSYYEHVYYYFQGGSLIQVDHGVRSPDVIIQNR